MGTSIVSVVSLSPSVECGTSEYWLWNLFYIPVVVLIVGTIFVIFLATRHSRNESKRTSVLNLSSLKSDEQGLVLSKTTSLGAFGAIWRAAFRDETPWWTSVELSVRLALIAIFSLTVTRAGDYTNLTLTIVILWYAFSFSFFPSFSLIFTYTYICIKHKEF